MLALINVSADYNRLKESVRARLVGPAPLFSWGAVSDRPNARQSACRVCVETTGQAWDSGWVETEEQSLQYAGEPLPEGEPARVNIAIRDDAGNESLPYTATVYNAYVDWKAGWIGDKDAKPGETVYLRRDFPVGQGLASAVLYICGIGYQKPYLDGEPLDAAALDPAHTDWTRQCQYVTYPGLESRLKPGAHCLGAMLGTGWRHNVLLGHEGVASDGAHYRFGGPVQLTAMLRLTYASGDTQWIMTDDAWQAGSGANRESDIFNGEVYDARRTAVGWNLPGFRGFTKAASVLPAPGGVMEPMRIPPIVEHRALAPIASWPVGEDRRVYDFGQNIAGVVRVTLRQGLGAGQTLTLTHAEELNEDGTLFTAPLRSARAVDTYIAAGDDRDLSVWQPQFTYHGFRYMQAEGDIAPAAVEAVELHTDMETHSHFRCGDALITRIHDICIATERANQHGILTDCPQRDERQGWMNDATVRFEETPYNFDIGAMFPKIIRDITDVQNAEGAICCTAPFVFGSQPADPVCSSFLVAGLEAWMHTGNAEVLRKNFDSFAAWERCLLDLSENYIVQHTCYGDWAGPAYACVGGSAGDGAMSAVTPGIYMSTGYSYFNCRLLAKFAAALGRGEDEALWRETAEKIRTAMLDTWYDPDTGKMCTGSQACQVFALWLGIIPEEDIPKAAARVHDELAGNGYRLTTGNLCSRYIMDVLTRCGYLDDVWTLLTRTEYPSLGFEIQQEATTVWERFELKKAPGMNSHDHPMYAAVDYWFWAYLCGIRPVEPGYRRVRIEPVFPEKLMSAQAVVDTVRGDVAVRWMKRYGQLVLHVTVPFGATAEVVFAGETHEVGSGFHAFSKAL